MRTLKKVLAVVLALAMVLGMAVTASAGYDDAKAITDKEAVEVLAAINVMVGTNNKFNPAGTLTRAEAAVLIANLFEGTAAKDLVAIQMFDDVDSSNWAAKYVAYCATKGIVAGVGNNKFNPTGKLTGTEFALMLLATLGYDAKIELTGANWAAKQVQIVALAKKVGILNSTLAKTATKELTREEAARYCLNALKSTMVEYETKGTTITVGGVEIVSGASKATAVTEDINTKNAWAGKIVGAQETAQGKSIYTVELGEKLYDGKLVLTDEAADSFGRPAVRWDYKGDKVGIYVETPVFTTTKEMTEDEVFTALGAAGTKSESTVKVAVESVTMDGVQLGEWDVSSYGRYGTRKTFTPFADDITKGKKAVYDFSGNGRVLEFFEGSDDNSFNAVVINEYFGSVTEVKAANTKKGTDAYVTFTDAYDSTTDTYKTDAFAKKDKVVVTKAFTPAKEAAITQDCYAWEVKGAYDVKSMVAATSVTGPISEVNGVDGTITVANKEYELSCYADDHSYSPALSTKDETVYVDSYGYVIGQGTAANKDNLIFVTKAAYTLTDDGDMVACVKGILSDGTEKTLYTAGRDTLDAFEGEICYYEETTKDDIYDVTKAVGGNSDNQTWTYRAQDLTLTKADTSINLTLGTKASQKYYLAEDLLMIAVDSDGAVQKATGIHDYTLSAGGGMAVVVNADNKVVAIMLEGTIEGANTENGLIFVARALGSKTKTIDGKNKTVYGYEAYSNGEEIEKFYATKEHKETNFYASYSVSDEIYALGNTYTSTTATQSVNSGVVADVEGTYLDLNLSEADTSDVSQELRGFSMSKVVNTCGCDVETATELERCTVYVVYNADTRVIDWVYVTAMPSVN